MHRQCGQTILWEPRESKERLDPEEKKFTMKISCGAEIRDGNGGDTAKAGPASKQSRSQSRQ